MAAANGIAENRMQMQNNESQGRGWVFDERDSFISWLRGEFAAANAIIDALCQHLRIVGDSAEYDHVLCSIQQRRCNWAALLHMQQYFSVAEVLHALQQVCWRKQHTNADHAQSKDRNVKLRAESAKKVAHKASFAQNGGFLSRTSHGENAAENTNGNSAMQWREGVAGSSSALHSGVGIHNLPGSEKMNSSVKAKEQEENSQCQVHAKSGSSGSNAGEKHHGPCNKIKDYDFRFSSKQEEDQRRSIITVSKNFVGNELVDGKMINIVEGLELHENIFDSSEISCLTSFVQELKLAGRKKKLRGQTFVISKRPMKGNGREMIQFGVPILNAPLEGEIATGTLKDSVEPIPTVMEDVINRLFRWQLIHERPDSCIINFFNEGDHSQPHMCPSYFERPLYMLPLLSECSMVFGRSIEINHPGDYKGPLKVSLHAGSLMVMQGNSADVARYAICSSPLPRATITFVKVQPKKPATFSTKPMSIPISIPQSKSNLPQPVDQRSSTSALVTVPREGRGVNQTALKNFNMPSIHTSGVLPVPSIHASQVNPCLPAPRIQPLFAGPTGPVGGYASMAVVPTAWMAVPRHPPRMATSGTGVFFPGSGSGSDPCQCVTLSQQQQVLGLSSGLHRSEHSFNGATSTEPPIASSSTLRPSNQTKPNQLAFDNFDSDTEKSSEL